MRITIFIISLFVTLHANTFDCCPGPIIKSHPCKTPDDFFVTVSRTFFTIMNNEEMKLYVAQKAPITKIVYSSYKFPKDEIK